MISDGIRTRRNFPAETWAVVRDAYLGGETAESIGARLGISVNTIRKRASRCGWTHAAHARAIRRDETAPPPVDPHQARAHAVAQAAALLAQGQAFEATALLKAAETLGRVMESIPDVAKAEAEEARSQEQIRAVINALIIRNVDAILSADAEGTDGQGLSQTFELAAFHWRARRMGPEVAAEDRERMGGQTYWDADGALIPLSTQDPDGAVAEALDEGEPNAQP